MHEHHANHHRLYDERKAAFQVYPRKASDVRRILRREAYKKAHHSLVSHMRCCHGWRGNSMNLSLEDLEALHDKLS